MGHLQNIYRDVGGEEVFNKGYSTIKWRIAGAQPDKIDVAAKKETIDFFLKTEEFESISILQLPTRTYDNRCLPDFKCGSDHFEIAADVVLGQIHGYKNTSYNTREEYVAWKKDNSHTCDHCGGLGIPGGTLHKNKVICDGCNGLGVVRLEHLPHTKCLQILKKQKRHLIATLDESSGSVRRVKDAIRRETARNVQLGDYLGEDGVTERKVKGELSTTEFLGGIVGKVIRCHNVPNQQYEVELTGGNFEDKLKAFYQKENIKYVEGEGDTHYIYVQRQELGNTRRRLASASRRRLPRNYAAPRPSEQALERRRLMNRSTSHVVVLEQLIDEIEEAKRNNRPRRC